MALYRKLPVVISAVKVNEALHNAANNWKELPEWLREAYDRGEVVFGAGEVFIQTLEGRMSGALGDWIIRGVKGELYPCKPEIFAATYEPA